MCFHFQSSVGVVVCTCPFKLRLHHKVPPWEAVAVGLSWTHNLSHHFHFEEREEPIWHFQAEQFPHLQSLKPPGIKSATCPVQKGLLNTSSGHFFHFFLGMHCQARLNLFGKLLNYSYPLGVIMDGMVMEPSTTNFNVSVSNCGHCFMYCLGHQFGNTNMHGSVHVIHVFICINTQHIFTHIYIYIYTQCVTAAAPLKRRTCFLKGIKTKMCKTLMCSDFGD